MTISGDVDTSGKSGRSGSRHHPTTPTSYDDGVHKSSVQHPQKAHDQGKIYIIAKELLFIFTPQIGRLRQFDDWCQRQGISRRGELQILG